MLVTLHFLDDFEYLIKTINDLYFAASDVFDVDNFSCFQAVSQPWFSQTCFFIIFGLLIYCQISRWNWSYFGLVGDVINIQSSLHNRVLISSNYVELRVVWKIRDAHFHLAMLIQLQVECLEWSVAQEVLEILDFIHGREFGATSNTRWCSPSASSELGGLCNLLSLHIMLGIWSATFEDLVICGCGLGEQLLHQQSRSLQRVSHSVVFLLSVKHISYLVTDGIVGLEHILPLGERKVGDGYLVRWGFSQHLTQRREIICLELCSIHMHSWVFGEVVELDLELSFIIIHVSDINFVNTKSILLCRALEDTILLQDEIALPVFSLMYCDVDFLVLIGTHIQI